MSYELPRSLFIRAALTTAAPWEDPAAADTLLTALPHSVAKACAPDVRLSGEAVRQVEAQQGRPWWLLDAAVAARTNNVAHAAALWPQWVHAAANPSVPPGMAAGWVNEMRQPDLPDKAVEVLSRRPDLPVAERLLQNIFGDDIGSLRLHRLAVRVVEARAAAQHPVDAALILNAPDCAVQRSVRASVALSGLCGSTVPHEGLLSAAAEIVGQSEVSASHLAGLALAELRADTLNEGPFGARPRWERMLALLTGRLDNLPSRLGDQLRAHYTVALHAAALPDPAASERVGELLPAGPQQRQDALDCCLRTQLAPPLWHGLPWWPVPYEQAVARAEAKTSAALRLDEAAHYGVADAAMLEAVDPAEHKQLWVIPAGHYQGPDAGSLPLQTADPAMVEVLGWHPTGRLLHDLNAQRYAAGPPADLRRVVAIDDDDEARRHPRATLGVVGELGQAIQSLDTGQHLAAVVSSAQRPIAALSALLAVA